MRTIQQSLRTIVRITIVATLVTCSSCRRPHSQTRIIDDRDILPTAAEARIDVFQSVLRDSFDIDMMIDVPAASPADLQKYAHDFMEERNVGAATSGARGVLLVVDVGSKMVRMEVGPGLEGVFPDAFVARIERGQMAPFFSENRVADGIEATVELLVGRVHEARASGNDRRHDSGDSAGPTASSRDDLAAGAGAQQPAPIGSSAEPVPEPETIMVPAQPTPTAVIGAYIEILRRRDRNPNHRVYSPDTRRWLVGRVVTRSQQDNEYRLLSKAEPSIRINERDSLAVGMMDGSRVVPPYFFVRGPEGWMLDLMTMGQLVRFDLQNKWFLVDDAGPYAFAFD